MPVVFDGWKPGVVKQILEQQKYIYGLWEKYPHLVNPYRLLILEDCMEQLTGDPVVEELASRGRHFKISVIVITQRT